ncbi:LytTR family DNA-binding domain-containing protein [Roseibium sp. MMSF_3412]|uniref:LytTR family DNA-binding domain-containing protein n=1 Tax=Roseibium sp. MMSF_3412 TaxID=3046712 RepID=UPI00273E07F7|nr:LytTR family DNA-binding domain-containing protein [Roseibium sp. MMSF_3412]
MIRSYKIQAFLLALASAGLLASTQIQRPDNWPLAGLYLYWSIRILLEAGLFVAFLELFARLPGTWGRIGWSVVLAALVSLVPFALAVTALDLILGLPELNELVRTSASATAAGSTPSGGQTHIGSFLLEIVYLSDNHFVLCALLSIPLFFQATRRKPGQVAPETEMPSDGPEQAHPTPAEKHVPDSGYQRHLEPPLTAPVLRAEAQEHYVRLTTASENRMVLYRFNDIVAELPAEAGMQVHRSHWVAFEAMIRLLKEDGRLWLELTDGERVPVSRKYADVVRGKVEALDAEERRAAT